MVGVAQALQVRLIVCAAVGERDDVVPDIGDRHLARLLAFHAQGIAKEEPGVAALQPTAAEPGGLHSAGRVEKFQRKFQGNYFQQKDKKKAEPAKSETNPNL